MDILEEVDFEDDYSVMNAIDLCSSDLLEGTNEKGEITIVSIEQGEGIRVTTFQYNGWIRINDYDLVHDDFGNLELVRSERYEK